jgi:hypothetical protein
MSSTNGNKGEFAVRLPISLKQLSTQMGVSVAQLMADLTFKLKVHASINMDLASDVVVALAELHNLRVKFLPGDDGVGS